MTLRILSYLTLVLSGVFTIYVPDDCFTQFAEESVISVDNQMQKPLTTNGQQTEDHQAALILLDHRRVIFYSKPRAMYADNMKIIAAEGMLAAQGSVRFDKDNTFAEEIPVGIA